MTEFTYTFPEQTQRLPKDGTTLPGSFTGSINDRVGGIISNAMGIESHTATSDTSTPPAGGISPTTSTPAPPAPAGGAGNAAMQPLSDGNSTPGLVNNTNSTGYTPTQVNLNPSTDTVEGRIGNILKNDSPLLQDARTRAAQNANKRGLINSSMAIGEGEKAVIQTALPIASQDANAAVQTAYRNQDATNTASQVASTAENAYRQQQLSGAQAMEQQQLRGEQSVQLANIEAQYKQQLQSSQSAAQFFAQVTTSIGEILKEPEIGVEQKQQLVQKQIQLLQNGMAVIGAIGNLDLSDLLTFPEISLAPPAPAPTAPAPPAPAPGGVESPSSNWNMG